MVEYDRKFGRNLRRTHGFFEAFFLGIDIPSKKGTSNKRDRRTLVRIESDRKGISFFHSVRSESDGSLVFKGFQHSTKPGLAEVERVIVGDRNGSDIQLGENSERFGGSGEMKNLLPGFRILRTRM
jgi:hypothetical protein